MLKRFGVLMAVICALCAAGVRAAATHDISVTIDNGTNHVVAGGSVTYSVTVANNGPDNALLSQIGINLEIEAMAASRSYTAAATGTASGFTASGAGYVDDFDVSIDVGSSITYTYSVTVASDARSHGPQLKVNVSANVYFSDIDPNLSNNDASDSDPIFAPVTLDSGFDGMVITDQGVTLTDFDVAVMTDPNGLDALLNYAAAIDWGDGETSAGRLKPNTQSEVQTVTIAGASGAFFLTFEGQSTGALAFNASAAQVEAALSALSSVGAGNVTVSLSGAEYTVGFIGTLANTNVRQMSASGAGGATASVDTVMDGGLFGYVILGDHILKKASPGGVPFQVSVAVAHGNLLTNPSFEMPVGSGQYGAIDGWTLETAGVTIEIANANIGAAFDGTQFVELNSTGASTISQTVPTNIGQTYMLNFAFSARGGSTIDDNFMKVRINGASIATISVDGEGKPPTAWSQYSFYYVATSATAKLEFASLSPANDGLGGLLDAVQFAPVLNPAAVVMGQIRVNDVDIIDLTGGNISQSILPGESTTAITGIATYTNEVIYDDASNDVAVIIWQDGETSPGTIVKLDDVNYRVDVPAHTYTSADVYKVQVRVTHAETAAQTVDAGFVTVYDTPAAVDRFVDVNFNMAKAIVLEATDLNNPALPISFSVTVQPLHGVLTGDAPNLTYTPFFGYFGADNFTFTATNTVPLSDTGTISLSVSVNSAPAIVGIGWEIDGDGFSDEFEDVAGTDDSDFSSTPTGSVITANTLQPLIISKAGIKLNFSKPNMDSITFSGTLPIPANYNPDGKRVLFDVGSVPKALTLTAKGTAVNGGDSVKLSIKSKRGVVSAQTAKYTVTFKNGGFANKMSASGLTDADAKAKPVTVVFTFIFDNKVYQVSRGMSYTAKVEKSGAAK